MKREISEKAIAITTVIGLLLLGMTVFSIAEDIFQERDAWGHKQEQQTNTRETRDRQEQYNRGNDQQAVLPTRTIQ